MLKRRAQALETMNNWGWHSGFELPRLSLGGTLHVWLFRRLCDFDLSSKFWAVRYSQEAPAEVDCLRYCGKEELREMSAQHLGNLYCFDTEMDKTSCFFCPTRVVLETILTDGHIANSLFWCHRLWCRLARTGGLAAGVVVKGKHNKIMMKQGQGINFWKFIYTYLHNRVVQDPGNSRRSETSTCDAWRKKTESGALPYPACKWHFLLGRPMSEFALRSRQAVELEAQLVCCDVKMEGNKSVLAWAITSQVMEGFACCLSERTECAFIVPSSKFCIVAFS